MTRDRYSVHQRVEPDRSGMVIVWIAAALAIAVGVLVAVVLLHAAPRSAASVSPRSPQSGAPQAQERHPGASAVIAAGAPNIQGQLDAVGEAVNAARTTGTASWYASHGPGHYAAAPWWRFGMDPEPVTVCRIDGGRSDCISLFVSDFCQCYVGTERERVIDLSRDAFAELAPPSAGLIRVQVERGAPVGPTLPPTSTDRKELP